MPKSKSSANGHSESPRSPEGKINGSAPHPSGIRGIRVSGFSEGHPIGRVETFLRDYIAMPETTPLVIATWTAAAYLLDVWDRFPHLGISSPEKRCGKTTLLELLNLVAPKPRYTTNISPAALYRIIEAERPTLLMDESQSLARRGSEQSEVIREILNAGIGPNAKVIRCGGANMTEIVEFSVYSPKVFAMIGKLDSVLADRTLPVDLRRKTPADVVKRFRHRLVAQEGEVLKIGLENWCRENRDKIQDVYDHIEPFPIDNDRMADLLTPLQAVLAVANGPREVLKEYAFLLDRRDREQEMQTPGVQLLFACKELFEGKAFIGTDLLIERLKARKEEPWDRWNRTGLNRETLSALLRPYDIRPGKYQKKRNGKVEQLRGYFARDFQDAWDRYTP